MCSSFECCDHHDTRERADVFVNIGPAGGLFSCIYSIHEEITVKCFAESIEFSKLWEDRERKRLHSRSAISSYISGGTGAGEVMGLGRLCFKSRNTPHCVRHTASRTRGDNFYMVLKCSHA